MEKYFRGQIIVEGFGEERIEREAALDGIYGLRTSAPGQQLGSRQTVEAYKRLAKLERAFRSLKSVGLEIRPVHHGLSERVRGQVFLPMLA